ncbi:hypothetical protein ACI3K4_27750 [Streptomyces sp. CSMPJR101]|uniref:hypothetical protein n=1 Tax=Streptomyces sp. CSMPJR101 TaxID=1279378 RepID=UPI0038539FD3
MTDYSHEQNLRLAQQMLDQQGQLNQLKEQLEEARQWARHGYEIGQRHCGWSDHGVAPGWLTEGWPPHIGSCEHLEQMAAFDEALTRVRALCSPEHDTPQFGRLRRAQDVLAAIDGLAAHTGPTVREAAAADRAYWEQRDAGEGA